MNDGPDPARNRRTEDEPADHVGVRRHNLSLVLRLLRDRGARSRASIAARTGLTRATVSSLVAELEERGLVHEVGLTGERRSGRPATLVEIDGRSVVSIGLEINVGHIAAVALDLSGRELVHRRRALEADQVPLDAVVRSLVSMAKATLRDVREETGTNAIGISLAVPGTVDRSTNTVAVAPNIGWRDIPLADTLRTSLGVDVPIVLDNGANLAAIAEHRLGEFAGVSDLIYLIGDIGVGAGIIVDGELLRGARGFASEVGHMALGDSTRRCACGSTGCWETQIGLRALLRRAMPDVADRLDDGSLTLSPEAIVGFVRTRADEGDATVLAALEQHADLVARGVVTLVNLFNPAVIALAGFWTELGRFVLPAVTDHVRSRTIARDGGGVTITLSRLGFSAAPIGGAMDIAERVFADPTIIARA